MLRRYAIAKALFAFTRRLRPITYCSLPARGGRFLDHRVTLRGSTDKGIGTQVRRAISHRGYCLLKWRRRAPACSDIPVSPAGDDARMPSDPPQRDRPEGP